MKSFNQFINEKISNKSLLKIRQFMHIDELKLFFDFTEEVVDDNRDLYYLYNRKLLFIYDKYNGYLDTTQEIVDELLNYEKPVTKSSCDYYNILMKIFNDTVWTDIINFDDIESYN